MQVTEIDKFPDAVRVLAETLNGPEFVAELEYITGIPNVVADPLLGGGGMHLTNSSGRLDVDLDFNDQEETK